MNIMTRSERELAEIRRIRRSLEEAMDRLLAVLDALDPEPDLEPDGSDEQSWQAGLRGGADVLAH